ncbi:unnamed protein product [Dicrocoelium dendriticum]|nr:unnamed protein product [Dicrocoelium dendriticum]
MLVKNVKCETNRSPSWDGNSATATTNLLPPRSKWPQPIVCRRVPTDRLRTGLSISTYRIHDLRSFAMPTSRLRFVEDITETNEKGTDIGCAMLLPPLILKFSEKVKLFVVHCHLSTSRAKKSY